jgi:hypothetical protein
MFLLIAPPVLAFILWCTTDTTTYLINPLRLAVSGHNLRIADLVQNRCDRHLPAPRAASPAHQRQQGSPAPAAHLRRERSRTPPY